MFILRFSDWELIYKLLEQRELQLRQMLEADAHRGTPSDKRRLKEYKQVCDTLKRLVGPSGRSWSNEKLAYRGKGLCHKPSEAETRPKIKLPILSKCSHLKFIPGAKEDACDAKYAQ